jgi:hypothetical protein
VSGGAQRGGTGCRRARIRTALRQPIDKGLEVEMENRALFAHDPERLAAIEVQKRRIARELKARKRR